LKQEKRHKLQLFYAILCSIEEEMAYNNNEESGVRPTHIQHYSRLSYDKMMNHFIELQERGMIDCSTNGLVSISSKGREFIKQYDELINLIESVGL
jgi:predicted transcriptional regulator